MQSRSSFEHITLENTLVAVWVADSTPEEMRRFVGELEKLWARHQTGIHAMCVIGERTAVPDAEVRKLLSQQFESMRGRLLCMSISLEKSGIEGTLSRAVLSTLLTIARRPFQMSVHFERREAANWLARQAGVPSAEKLLETAALLERRSAA